MSLTRNLRLAAAVIAAALTLSAAAAPPAKHAAQSKLPELKFEKFTLPNGLTVITHEDHRLPLVSVDLWYHVGPLNERVGRTGFAHLFEHMMFEGSEHVGEKAHIKFVQGAGATDVNGTTDFDRTNYFETLPSNQLELGLWLESDRMGFLMEGLDRVKLANQRDVVRNERRQGEGSPYDVADEQVYHMLFPAGHPYYGSVIGSHADIEAARIADIRDFHQQFYTPNNASIAIAGDFDPKQLKALLIKYFGPIPQGPAIEPLHIQTPAITSQRRATVTDTVKLSQLQVAWLTPKAFTPEAANVEVAMHALGGAKASRLDQALIYKNQVAQSVRCGSRGRTLTGITECSITAKPGVKLEDLEATLWAEIAKLQAEGPTAQEVEAAKALSLTRKITGLQRLGGFGGIADTLNEYNQFTGDPGYLPKDIATLEAVTANSARLSAAKYLTKDSAVVVYCVPGKKVLNDVPRSPDDTDADVKIVNPYTEAFEAEQNWRKTPPAAGPQPAVHLPTPKTFSLKNGMKVYIVEEKSLPVLSASIVTRAGTENSTVALAGLPAMTSQLMQEATTTRDVTRLSEDQERIGTRIGGGANTDAATLSLTVLTSNIDAGMDLLSDVVLHPAFNPKDIERVRKQRLVAISQEGDSVSAIASRVGPKLVFGTHPYGISPTTESISAIKPEDLANFYHSNYGPANSALIFAGDISEPEARRVAEHYFGAWTGTAPALATLPPAPPAQPTHVVIVDKPGAPQTALFAFGLAPAITTPDLQAIQVMNYVLGGSFASRINMNLREEHGYTYGADSQYRMFRTGGGFGAGGLVRTNITAPATKELMFELNRIQSNPPTADEIKMAKAARIQSLPGQFETTAATANAIAPIFIYNRPLNYYSTLPAMYDAITTDAAAHIAQTDVDPNHVVILAVGDRDKIEPGLKDLNLGPIEHRDALGNPIK